MNLIKGFGLFWYRFIVGDDWIGATIIVGGFIATGGLVRASISAFWVLPVTVIVSLTISLFRIAGREENR